MRGTRICSMAAHDCRIIESWSPSAKSATHDLFPWPRSPVAIVAALLGDPWSHPRSPRLSPCGLVGGPWTVSHLDSAHSKQIARLGSLSRSPECLQTDQQ